jgi:hypothetical protein
MYIKGEGVKLPMAEACLNQMNDKKNEYFFCSKYSKKSKFAVEIRHKKEM